MRRQKHLSSWNARMQLIQRNGDPKLGSTWLSLMCSSAGRQHSTKQKVGAVGQYNHTLDAGAVSRLASLLPRVSFGLALNQGLAARSRCGVWPKFGAAPC